MDLYLQGALSINVVKERIAALHEHLRREDTMAEAAETLRRLVVRINLAPEGSDLAIVLRGDPR